MTKDTLGIMGVGAFGSLMVQHLAPHFELVLFDPHKDLTMITKAYDARWGVPADVADCSVLVLAVPVQALKDTLKTIAPHLKPGTLVLDVCSVKVGPTQLMKDILPSHVEIVGTHPLFGPQSGKKRHPRS